MRLRRVFFLVLCGMLAVVTSAGAALGVQSFHDRVVNDDPADFTPHVLDGRVNSIVQIGEKMFVGGNFSQVQEAGNDTVLTRNNLFAFDATTGEVDTGFTPNINGAVEALLPAPGGGSVYVGGAFSQVNGVWQLRVARLNVQNGQPVSGFSPDINSRVKDLRLSGGRLYVAGLFGQVDGVTHRALAAIDPDTGQRDPFVNLDVSGTHSGGRTKVLKMDVSPDGSRLAAVGNFTSVGGLPRRQIVMLDLTGGQAQVANWYTPRYEAACASAFDTYMRDVDFSPNGGYFVVTTTGAYRSPPRLCDTHARWETSATGTNIQPTWVNYTGGDTSYAVAVTGTAVYVGGHFRWANNPFAADRPGPGAVPREGIAALDPINGLPLSWDPGRTRGVGVFDMLATPQGLWVGSDTDRIGNWEYHGRLAFMPLAGGEQITEPFAGSLPGDVHLVGPGFMPNNEVRKRHYDGQTVGATSTVPGGGVSWSNARGSVMLNGTLYTAWSDGNLYARSFDGSTFGSANALNLHGLDAFSDEMQDMTGMFYADGRLYFTLSGSSNLYYRYFTPESGVVGAQRFTASGSVPGVDFFSVDGMFLAGDKLYFTDRFSGDLRRADFADGAPVPGTAQTVSGPGVDGNDWRAGDVFLYAGADAEPPNEAPTAEVTAECAELTCSFSGEGSTDPDGTIVSYDWDFGDGTNGSGVTASHTYQEADTYQVTLTVTDDRGGTDTASRQVSVEAPPISFVGSDVSNGNWSARTVTVPGDVATGDGLLLFLTANRTDVTISDPGGGWTAVGTQDTGSAVTRMWQKVADGSDAGQQVTVNMSGIAKADLLILAYHGTDGEAPTAAVESAVETTVRADHTTPAISTTAAGSWVVSYWGEKSSSTTSWTPPGGEAVRSASYGLGGGRISTLATDSGGQVPVGGRGGRTATADSANRHATMWSVVLAPKGT